jgi:molybdopterin-guanine dinucleotide biosynthesis protein A
VRDLRPLGGFVLAGGRSTRMGRDKALVEFEGRPLIERALASVRTVADWARIAGDRADLARFAPVVEDRKHESGPLAGIHAALVSTNTDWNIFLPVDLPLLPAGLLRWMVNRVERTGALATVPVLAGVPQPLVAVYHRALLPGLERSLEAGDLKTIRAVLEAAESAHSPAPRIDLFSLETLSAAGQFSGLDTDLPLYRWFQNVNTPSELDACVSMQK